MKVSYHPNPNRVISPQITADGVFYKGCLLDPQFLKSTPVSLKFENHRDLFLAVKLIEKNSLPDA